MNSLAGSTRKEHNSFRKVELLMIEGAEAGILGMFLEDTVSFAEIQPVDFEAANQVH